MLAGAPITSRQVVGADVGPQAGAVLVSTCWALSFELVVTF